MDRLEQLTKTKSVEMVGRRGLAERSNILSEATSSLSVAYCTHE